MEGKFRIGSTDYDLCINTYGTWIGDLSLWDIEPLKDESHEDMEKRWINDRQSFKQLLDGMSKEQLAESIYTFLVNVSY